MNLLKNLDVRPLLAGALLCLASLSAHAQSTRTWVSSTGLDSNACSRAAPCASFAGAYNKTHTGGVINVVDAGAYGGVIISKSITIEGAAGSQNGVLAYRAGSGTSGNVQLSWFDRNGKFIQNVGAPGPYRGVDLSPDGKRIALHRHEATGGDLWLLDLVRRGTLSRFTFESTQDNSGPIWSPDGTRIAYGSFRNGKWGVHAKAADGTGPA